MVKSVSRDNGRDLWFGEVSAWLREFSASSTLFASRNRNPKEGGPDSPPWVTHEQGGSASSNQGIPPHYAVLDLGTTRRERGEGNQETRALGVVISSRATPAGFTGRLIEPQPFMTMMTMQAGNQFGGTHDTDGAVNGGHLQQ